MPAELPDHFRPGIFLGGAASLVHTAVLIYNAVTNIFDKIVLLVKSTLLYSRILVILVILS